MSREGIIIELCEQVTCDDQDAPKVHFQELATITKSQNSNVYSQNEVSDENLPAFKSFYKALILGKQEETYISMCVVRLPKVTTDLVVYYSSPQEIDVETVFYPILKTLEIKDWTLFGK